MLFELIFMFSPSMWFQPHIFTNKQAFSEHFKGVERISAILRYGRDTSNAIESEIADIWVMLAWPPNQYEKG